MEVELIGLFSCCTLHHPTSKMSRLQVIYKWQQSTNVMKPCQLMNSNVKHSYFILNTSNMVTWGVWLENIHHLHMSRGNQPLVNKGCLFLTDLTFFSGKLSSHALLHGFFSFPKWWAFQNNNVVHTSFGCFIFWNAQFQVTIFLPLELEGYLSSIIGGKKKLKIPPNALQSVKTWVVGLGFNSASTHVSLLFW